MRRISAMTLVGAMALVVCCLLRGEVHAGFTFLGPSPYLSAADSPFSKNLDNPDFFLEDFEDGELNTPGIRQRNLFPIFGDAALGTVVAPSLLTDSVDMDDGSIDGAGRDGFSFRTNVMLERPTLPPGLNFSAAFDFQLAELGFVPNAFGVVWTDGPSNSSFSLLITTITGDSFSTPLISGVGGTSRLGETDEDFAIGVFVPSGIVSVMIRGGYIGELQTPGFIEIDHLQYGYIVPEVHSAPFTIIVLFLTTSLRRSLRNTYYLSIRG